MGFVLFEVGIRNADLLESHLVSPLLDIQCELREVVSNGSFKRFLCRMHNRYDNAMGTMPYNLYRAAQIRKLDHIAIKDYGIPGETLMERAGAAAYDLLRHRWPQAKRICVLCGVGNNGGDGFVVARLAHEGGLEVNVFQTGKRNILKGAALNAAQAMGETGLEALPFTSQALDSCEVIVDALLGTGLDREVEGEWRMAIEAINRANSAVLAVDIPSGLHADSGRVLGDAVRADMTITFIGMKQGMLTGYGPDYCGEILFNDLQVPADVYEQQSPSAVRIVYDHEKYHLKPRPRAAHKGLFGHLLVIGGDHGMAGAVRMAGEAALRSGAGLVSIATRAPHAAAISAVRPELMAHGIEAGTDLRAVVDRATVIAAGPGLGRSTWAQSMLDTVIEARKPAVLDADALNLLAENPIKRDNWILTPHPGEAARLLKTSTAAVQSDRFAAVRSIQHEYGGVCVLKGAGSLIDDGNDPLSLCSAGNPGMASGGMGDVLTGVIAGLLAQGMKPVNAVQLAVCVHAEAGDRVATVGERGILATDLFPFIQRLVNPY